VKIYCLRKQASYECFQLFAVFLLVTLFIIATIVHDIIVNTDYRRLKFSTGTRNNFFWRLWTVWARALKKVRQPCTAIFKTVQKHNRSTIQFMWEEGQNATARLVSQLLQYLQWLYCFVIERPWVRLSILKSIPQDFRGIPQSHWWLLG